MTPKRLLEMAPDPVPRRSVVESDKSLLPVSATRAKKRLFWCLLRGCSARSALATKEELFAMLLH
jgi:hypothetical protein